MPAEIGSENRSISGKGGYFSELQPKCNRGVH